MGQGTLCPAQHEPMPTLLLQGTDGVPGLRGQPGQEGPGVSPQEWVAGCGVLSSTLLQLPKALQGNALFPPPPTPYLLPGFEAQGLVGMTDGSQWWG